MNQWIAILILIVPSVSAVFKPYYDELGEIIFIHDITQNHSRDHDRSALIKL